MFSNAAHPGIVATGLVTNNAVENFGTFMGALISAVVWLRNAFIAYDVNRGALTSLFLAASPKVDRGGGYFVPVAQSWRVAHPLARDAAFGEALWKWSEDLLRGGASS